MRERMACPRRLQPNYQLTGYCLRLTRGSSWDDWHCGGHHWRMYVVHGRGMKRQRRLSARVGFLALACAVALSCSSEKEEQVKPRIDGTIHLTSPGGKPVPQSRVKVTLLRGDVRELFSKVYRTTPEAKARRALIASLEATRREKRAAYERARAALLPLELPTPGVDPTDCQNAVVARLAEADAEYLAYIRSFEKQLDDLDVSAKDVAATLDELQKKARREEERELRSLVDEYQRRHLELQTSVLYDGRGAAWDRLCWRIANRGHLNVAGALLSITYNGRRVPIETARLLWNIPGDKLALNFEARDPNGETVYGLEAGGTAKGCFFAADRGNLTEHRELLESQGLGDILSPRSGEWAFVLEAVSVTRTARVETTDRNTSASYRFFPPQPLKDVFAPELSARRPTFRAQALLDELTKSPPGVAWEQARQASLACRTVVEMRAELAQLDEKLVGLHSWVDVDPLLEGRVGVILEEMGGAKQDPTDAEETLAGIVAERREAETTTGRDGTFEFADLEPATYTVLARQEAEGVGWIEVIHLRRQPTVAELRRQNAIRGSLAKTLARLD